MLTTATLTAATLCTGLTAGLLVCFAHAVMPGLATLDDADLLRAFARVDAAIANPWMGLAWLGSPVLTLVALVLCAGRRDAALACLGVAAVLVLATQVVTGVVHLPLNAAVRDAAPSFADPASLRQRFEGPWVRWNVVRAVTSTGATVATVLALALRPG